MLPFIDGYLHIKKWLIPCWNIDVKEYCRLIGSGHFKPWPDDQGKNPKNASKTEKEKKKKKERIRFQVLCWYANFWRS